MKDKTFSYKVVFWSWIGIILTIILLAIFSCASLRFPDKVPSGNNWYWSGDTLKIG